MASWQQAGIVLVALVSTLLPKEIPGGLDDEADDQLLGKIQRPCNAQRPSDRHYSLDDVLNIACMMSARTMHCR